MKKTISITLKLFSSIPRDLGLPDYDPAKGLHLSVPSGVRLKKVLKDMGLTKLSSYAYFRQGERITHWAKLADGDEISCLKPSSGG